MSAPGDDFTGVERLRGPGRERRLKVWQRIGWALLALVVVAAAAGLVGPGPLSDTTRTDPSGRVQLEYERFVRHVADTEVQVQVWPGPAQPGMAQLWISAEYLSGVQLQQVQPEPDSWVAGDGGVVLTFPVRGPGPVTVELQLRSDQVGLLTGAVGLPGREPLEFWQFVYP